MPRRRFLVAALVALAAIVLPIAASGYISTGAGGDTSWYWSNPLPQGNDILAQSWVSTSTAWAVGRSGVALKTTNGGSTWTYQDPQISSAQSGQVDLSGVSFGNASQGWLAGMNAVVRRTTDGGSTWTTQTLSSDMTGQTTKAVAVNGSRIIVVGTSGAISYSSDGGSTWQNAGTNPARTASNNLVAISWSGPSTAFVGGDNGFVQRTTDGGATWTRVASGITTYGVTAISFAPSSTVGYVVTTNGTGSRVMRTIDNGTNWTSPLTPLTTALYSVNLYSTTVGVVAGANGQAYYSTNANATFPTWTNVTISAMSGAGAAVRSLQFVSSSQVWAMGDLGVVSMSNDGGVTWDSRSTAVTANLYGGYFTDSLHGWTCGASGTLQRTLTGGSSWSGTTVGGTGYNWRGAYFTSNLVGVLVGDTGTYGAVARTSDGGVNWTYSSPNTGATNILRAVSFCATTPLTGFAAGNTGRLIVTQDGGATWTMPTRTSTNILYGVYARDRYNGFAVGTGRITRIYSTNGGSTWTDVNITCPTANVLYSICGVPGTSTMYAVGQGGVMLRSTDGGLSWTDVSALTGTTSNLQTVYFRDENHGWIAGANGVVRYWNGSSFVPALTSGLPTGSTVPTVNVINFPQDSNVGYYFGDSGTMRKSADGGANWATERTGTYSQLNAVDFTDKTRGWIAGHSGVVLNTTDGGNTWQSQTSGTTNNIYGISFGSNTAGWIVGAGGVVRRTTDGGASWTAQTSGVLGQLNGIAAASSTNAIMVGASGVARYTTNSGTNWNAGTVPYTDSISAVAYPSTSTPAIAVATVAHTAGDGHPAILRTTNSGSTWTGVSTASQPMNAVSFAPAPDANVGWAVGGAGVIYKSTDSGVTWTQQTSPLSAALYSVSAVSSQTAFAMGANGYACQTNNGGTTWLTQNTGYGPSPSTVRITALAFTDANTGYAVGTGGTILRTTSQTPPITSLSVTPASPDGNNGWYAEQRPTITLTPDQQSTSFYSWDVETGPYTTYTGIIQPSEGTHSLWYYSVNAANRMENPKSAVFMTDLTSPTTPGTPNATPSGTNGMQLSWTGSSDVYSGVDHYAVYFQPAAGGPVTLATTTTPVTLSALVTGLTANTSYNFWIAAVDAAGNVSDPSTSINALTDSLPPLSTTATPTPLVPDATNGSDWYITTPTVALTSYPLSTPAYTHFAWDSSAAETYTAPFEVPSQGTHTLHFSSTDQAGQCAAETSGTLVLRFDRTSPVAPTVSASAASTNALSVTWSGASDSQSGVDHYVLWVGGSQYGTYTGTSATVTGLTVNTPYSVYVVAVNGAGLSSMSSSVNAQTSQNPAVSTTRTVIPSTPNGTNGWYRTDPSITLASMPATVAATTYYAWDGAAPAQYAGGTLSVPSDGTHELAYFSVDQQDATNREDTKTVTFRRDTAAPAAPATMTAVTQDTTSVAVEWAAATDSLSGFDHYVVYVDGVAFRSTTSTSAVVTGLTPASLHQFAVATVDGAGNESFQTGPVWAAAAASAALSTVAIMSPLSPDGTNGWYRTAPTITLATSPEAVLADTYYGWDGSDLVTYTAPISAADGTHTLYFWSIDQAREHAAEETHEVTYRVDASDPSVPSGLSAVGASTSSLDISWGASADSVSGIDHYEVYVGGVLATSTALTSVTVDSLIINHAYSVYVVAVNGSGRTSQSTTVTGNTQGNATVSTITSITPETATGLDGWYLTTPTVTLTGQPESVPSWTKYSWDGSSLVTYTAALEVPEGDHVLRYYTVDQADSTNQEATQTLNLKYDALEPSPPTGVSAVSVDTTSIMVEWPVGSDSGSGIDHYLVFADGVQSASVSATHTTISGFLPNSLHTFYVQSVDRAGRLSAASPSTTAMTSAFASLVTTAVVTPAIPTGLNGWFTTTPTVTFSVAPSVPATTYYSWDGGALVAASGSITPPSSGTHTLSFWSIDQAGERNAENTQTLTFRVDPTPDTKESTGTQGLDMTLTQGLTSDTQVNLTWTPAPVPPSGFDHYEVWDEYVGSTTSNSYLVSGLTADTTYNFAIYAVNGAGVYYSQSETITVTTSPTPLPESVSVVLATAPSGGFVKVAWQPVSTYVGQAGYHIWRSSNGVTFSQIATTTGQFSNYYTDNGLPSSTRYWYGVTAFDDRGEGSMSDVSAATWDHTSVITGMPQRVSSLSAVPGSSTVLLSWGADTNPAVTGYYVTREDRSMAATETTLNTVPIAAETTTSYVDTSAVNGQTYYYRVYPVDASSTVGLGSIEMEAKPRSVLTTATNVHLISSDNSYTNVWCNSCHGNHPNADIYGLFYTKSGLNENLACLNCHAAGSQLASNDTSSEILDSQRVSGVPIWTMSSTESTLSCGSCHREQSLDNSPTAGLLSVGGQGMTGYGGTNYGDGVCYYCHGTATTLKYGNLTVFENSSHVAVPNPASGSEIKCMACHESHASRNEGMTKYAGYMLCVQCHSGGSSDPNQPDVWSKLTLNDDPNSKHPLTKRDQTTGARMACQNCHNTHSLTLGSPLVDPHSPSVTGTWTADVNTFCFRCHDGERLPTSADTTPWAEPVLGQNAATTTVNIRDVWSTNVHGTGTASNPVTVTAYLRPDMGYLVDDSLDCTDCHDPHGTTNNYALNTTVKSANGLVTVSGLSVFKIPAGSITPTSPVGYDFRFFCSSCHVFDPATHDPIAGTDTTEFGKVDCTECHRHVALGGAPGTGL